MIARLTFVIFLLLILLQNDPGNTILETAKVEFEDKNYLRAGNGKFEKWK